MLGLQIAVAVTHPAMGHTLGNQVAVFVQKLLDGSQRRAGQPCFQAKLRIGQRLAHTLHTRLPFPDHVCSRDRNRRLLAVKSGQNPAQIIYVGGRNFAAADPGFKRLFLIQPPHHHHIVNRLACGIQRQGAVRLAHQWRNGKVDARRKALVHGQFGLTIVPAR